MKEEQRQEILEQIEEKQEEKRLKEEELDDYDDSASYEDLLNECNPSLFGMSPAYILEQLDPIAYRCGLSDYEDEWRSELENEISDLEEEIKDLKEELKC